MRKLKNLDSELRALVERARQLRSKKLQQLGELVVATDADALPLEVLTGALLGVRDAKDAALREGWRTQGAAFFHRTKLAAKVALEPQANGAPAASEALPVGGETGSSGQ